MSRPKMRLPATTNDPYGHQISASAISLRAGVRDTEENFAGENSPRASGHPVGDGSRYGGSVTMTEAELARRRATLAYRVGIWVFRLNLVLCVLVLLRSVGIIVLPLGARLGFFALLCAGTLASIALFRVAGMGFSRSRFSDRRISTAIWRDTFWLGR